MTDYVGPYLEGEQPAAPVAINVDDVTDLNAYDEVTVVGLPVGTYVISSDQEHLNQILYTFTAPLVAGHYEALVSMNGADGTVDLSSTFYMDVNPSPLSPPPDPDAEPDEAVVTQGEVYTITGKHVSAEDIERSTLLISSIYGIPLWSDEWVNSLLPADQKRLQVAVAYTATMPTVDLSSGTVTGSAGAVKSASVGDVSVSYGDSGGASEVTSMSTNALGIHPISAIVLDQLSWKSAKTVWTEPRGDYGTHLYTTSTVHGPLPIVRGMPTEDMLWG